jgi:hypothetical protein
LGGRLCPNVRLFKMAGTEPACATPVRLMSTYGEEKSERRRHLDPYPFNTPGLPKRPLRTSEQFLRLSQLRYNNRQLFTIHLSSPLQAPSCEKPSTGGDGGGNCTAGYSPCIPPGSDVDCAGGSGNGPRYVDGPRLHHRLRPLRPRRRRGRSRLRVADTARIRDGETLALLSRPVRRLVRRLRRVNFVTGVSFQTERHGICEDESTRSFVQILESIRIQALGTS